MMTLWLRHEYTRREGRRGRDWFIHDTGGALRFTAYARRVPGPIEVFAADDPGRVVVRGRPRRSFPLTGRYDVLAPPDTRIGVATRGGRFYTTDGRRLGRFRDARSLKRGIGEGIAVAVLDSLLAGDAGASDAAGGSAFILQLEGAEPGRLLRQRLPFLPDDTPRKAPGRVAKTLRRVLPKRAGDALLEKRAPRGWLLEVPELGTTPEPLLLTAALLTIEVALW